jgi:hypothetical protein
MAGSARYLGIFLTGCCLACGCRGTSFNPFSPGPTEYQQRRAQHFDPYIDNIAGPEVPDARPRDYMNPPPEATRARWFEFGSQRYGH